MAEAILEDGELEAYDGDGTAETMAAPSFRWRRYLILLLMLPWFGGVFSYLKDFTVVWAIAKAFPVISLPLVLVLLWHERVPVMRQILITLLYMILVPSFTGMFSFHQNFFLGLTSQVKLLPILYFFSFLALLYLVRPTLLELGAAFLTLAVITFAILVPLWLFAPKSWYISQYTLGDNPLLTLDDRGYRIRMPMYFGLIGLFYCVRRFFLRLQWIWLVLTAGMFSLLIFAVKTRAFIVGSALLMCLNAVRLSGRKTRLLLLVLIPFALIGLLNVPIVASVFNTTAAGGFTVREVTVQKAVAFLGTSVPRWALGVGSITPLDQGGMMVYFNHFFFLADITWVGVVFEYGVIGALLFLALPLRGIWISRKLKFTRENLFLGSLQDYLIYAILVSPLSALILAPGEFAVILAVFVYEWSVLSLEAE